MKAAIMIAAAAGMAAASLVYAQSGPDVVKAKCAVCHDADKKKIEPALGRCRQVQGRQGS